MDAGIDVLERLLDVAEALFMRKGYGATTLRDISSALGVTHSSLYYHFSGGKEELFIAVSERNIERHRVGLATAISGAGTALRSRLVGVAAWLLSQYPMDLLRMVETDMPALPPAAALKLMRMIHHSILEPLKTCFKDAQAAGCANRANDPDLLAGAFFGLVESLHATPAAFVARSKMDMAIELIEIMLKGIDYAEGEPV